MQHDYNGFPGQRIARSISASHPQRTQVIDHNGRDLLLPVFDSADAIRLTPRPERVSLSLPESPVLRDLGTTWDVRKYAEARGPVSLGTVSSEIREAFVQPLPVWTQHVLDMPIKFPGTDVRIPSVLASVVPALQRIIDIDATLNRDYDRYYAYLSIHQAQLLPGERMRENPFHVDGFQGPRWTDKHPVNRSYLLSDQLGTSFYPIGFPLDHLDLEIDDVYAEFERVIEANKAKPQSSKDFELILMDAYCVHRGAVAEKAMFRTWMRVSWETRVFDRLGNTHNPLFDYNWPMVARDTDLRIRPRPVLTA